MKPGRIRAAMLVAVLVGLPSGATADPPARLVADIATTPDGFFSSMGVVEPPAVLADRMYFPFDDGISGRELWTTDGTPGGTHRVADICPGRCWSFIFEIAVAGDRIFFAADDGAHGNELWASDGTESGTYLVKDIEPGIAFSRPQWLTSFGDRVFFQARDTAHGTELWTSDGTPEGTHLVADVNPGPEGSEAQSPLALADDVLFFAEDGVHGLEPYSTTGVGVTFLGDLNPGSKDSFFANLFGLSRRSARLPNGLAVFRAVDQAHGEELWITDGSPEGTTILADLVVGTDSSDPSNLVPVGDVVFFTARIPATGPALWKTDGTPGGTLLVADPEPGPEGSGCTPLVGVGDRLYFIAHSDAHGDELWKSDGDSATTVEVADVYPGPESGMFWAFFARPAPLGDRLVFFAEDGVHGLEPWITDGTPENTSMLGDLWTGQHWSIDPFSHPPGATSLAGRTVFFASSDTGQAPWVTDGTSGGTEELRRAETNESSITTAYWVLTTEMAEVAGELLFNAFDTEHGVELWRTRGTPGSTHLVRDLEPGATGSYPYGLLAIPDRLLFVAHTAEDDIGIWSFDSHDPGTQLVQPVEVIQWPLEELGSWIFFTAADLDHGEELWKTDGSPGGTTLVADLRLGPMSSNPALLAVANDELFFTATEDGVTRALWTANGTEIEHVVDLPPSWSEAATRLGERVAFDLSTEDSGAELWISDGTEEGTHLVKEILPGPGSGFDRAVGPARQGSVLTSAGALAYFIGDDGLTGRELWSSDGTADNTIRVADVFPGAQGSQPRWLTPVGDRLFFVADDGVHGRELWRTDPAAGAMLVADVLPGPESSRPAELKAVDGLLYFAAFRPGEGVELWVSDGTAAGTVLVQDIGPGAESSTPEKLTPSGRRLYFTAYDGEHGYEPWALLLPTRLPRGELSLTGDFHPGGLVTLTIRLVNPPPEALEDGLGDELVLTLPAELVPFAASATAGEAALAASGAPRRQGAGMHLAAVTAGDALLDGQVLTWNGSLAPGGETLITVRARIRPDALPATLELQGTLSFDSDGDGENDELLPTDDPSSGGNGDPTPIVILAPQSVLEIPTLSQLGLAALALLLLGAAVHRLRRLIAL